MQRYLQQGLVLTLVVVGMASAAAAAEQSAATATENAPAATPASTGSAAATMQLGTAEGTIAALDLQSAAPSVKIVSAEGKSWILAVDPKLVTVSRNGEAAPLSQLTIGAHVQARYTGQEGKLAAKSITITQNLPAQTSPSSSSGS